VIPAARLSIILPTFNEAASIQGVVQQLLALLPALRSRLGLAEIEILVVDDDSADGTATIVRELCLQQPMVRLIRRVGRRGLASAIKEGLLDATGDIAVVMDSDGQHEVSSVVEAVSRLQQSALDLVIGSRFHDQALIQGLSRRRETGSAWANAWARWSLPARYHHLTDFLSGCFALRLASALPLVRAVDVNGFKFLYELLAISGGKLRCGEIPLRFQPRTHGRSKLDLAIVWDFGLSLLHNYSFRLLPRRAISFALVGATGVLVQLSVANVLLKGLALSFNQAVLCAALTAATSNFLINNALTFRFQRLHGLALVAGLLRFWLVASLPVVANVGVASAYFDWVQNDVVWAQLAGILVVFVWNYAASSRFVWNTP
jgi:dolichol-phosphate mannosyltransferase